MIVRDGKRFNCCESVLIMVDEGYPLKGFEPNIMKAASSFGGEVGGWGSACGAVTGAVIALALVHGTDGTDYWVYKSEQKTIEVTPLGKDAPVHVLFQVFADRYERASTLVTTNLPFAEWTRVFGDASLTAALLDRLTHRCHIHEFDWESIRLTESLQRQGKKRASQKSRSSEQADESS